MCGICGIYSFDGAGPPLADKSALEGMLQKMADRGPDDEGTYFGLASGAGHRIGLGHRRLSIIDVAGGHQPVHNEDKNIWITYNGEIYNFIELKGRLQMLNHRFYTSSDTEVIVHLYEEYGAGCLKHLRGMFAFAVWDERRKELFLARDRVGKKPLYYAEVGGSIVFASDIKAILEVPGFERKVNLEAMHHYLTYQYVPSPLTMFEGIWKLPPASWLLQTRKSRTVERYWELKCTPALNISEEDCCDEILRLLGEATGLRMISEVPIGAFLSGGIDSSAVVAMMAKFSEKPVKTFSIAFEEEEYNEIKHARVVAGCFGTDHHEYTVKADAVEVLPKLVWHYAEPFADSSAVATYHVARITRPVVTVALNGDGGDESWGGYERYVADRIAGWYCRIPPFLREGVMKKAIMALPDSVGRWALPRKLKRLTEAVSLRPEYRYARWMCFFDNDRKNRLYSPELREKFKENNSYEILRRAFDRCDAGDFTAKAMFVDAMTYLPDDLLVKMDVATMANSVEGRSPVLDHILMEFAARVPSRLKLKGFTTKYILRKALRGTLPGSILRRGKRGFGVPIGKWMRGELRGFMQDMLFDGRLLKRGYFDGGYLRDLAGEHTRRVSDHGYRLWALLVLELWHRTFIDGQ